MELKQYREFDLESLRQMQGRLMVKIEETRALIADKQQEIKIKEEQKDDDGVYVCGLELRQKETVLGGLEENLKMLNMAIEEKI